MKTPKYSLTAKLGSLSPIKTLTLAAALAVPALTASAQTLWTGGTADYNNPALWNGTYNGGSNPNTSNDNGSNNVVLIQPADPTWQHGDTLAGNGDNTSGAYLQTGSINDTGGGNWLRMGIGNNSYGSYILSNGVVNVGGRTQIGEKGTGYLEIDGGTYNGNVNDGGANPAMVCGQGDFGPGTGTLVINGGIVNMPRETWIGEQGGSGTGNGTFFMNGGTYNANDWFAVARAGAPGVLNITNGTINKTGNGDFLIGTGGTGFMNQTGGVVNINNGNFRVGDGTTATYNMAGGSLTNFGELWVAQGGGSGTINMSGGTLTANNWFQCGRGGTALLNMTGGTIHKTTVAGTAFIIGDNNPGRVIQTGGTFVDDAQYWIGNNSTSELDFTNGTLTVSGGMYVGLGSGNGTFNLAGGTVTNSNVFHIAQDGSSSGTVNLIGGSLYVNEVTTGNALLGVSTLNLNGGTILALGDNPTFLHDLSSAYVLAGGAIFDSQGHSVTVSQNLQDNGGGGLTKNGAGMLTLAGVNSYNGNTVVNAGTLAVTTATATSGTGGYTVANGAALNLQVATANGQLNATSLTLASTASTLNLDLNSFGNPTLAPVNVSGALAVNGTVTINIADGLPQISQFPLIKYGSKSGSGSFVLGSIPIGVVATLVNNTGNHSIDLNITSVSIPRWDGSVNGNWDIGLTANWVNIANNLPTIFSQGNPVVFNDSAAGTTAVNLTTTVNPSAVTINNSTLVYTLTGTGKISGSTSLIKQGSGTVTIANTGGNNFTGPVVISGGVLSVASLANGGSPSAIGASSASPTNLVLDGGALSYSGPAVTINRGYLTQQTNSTITTVSNLTLTGTANATLLGGLTKTGNAQLTYAAAGSNVLSGASSPGYIVQAGSVLFDGSNGGQTNLVQNDFSVVGSASTAAVIVTNATINTTSDMSLGNVPNTAGTLTLNNGATLNVGSWFTLSDSAGSTGTCTMNSGSTLNVNNGRLFLCSNQGTYDTLNINGGTINKSGDYFAIVNGGWNGVGAARTGIVNQVSGTVNCSSECWIGDSGGPGNGSLGVYNLSGGTLNLGNWFGVGRDGSTGIFNMTNGILNKTSGGDMVIGRGGSAGTFNMVGGTITKDNNGALIVGQGQGVGELDQSGGSITTTGEYWLGVDNGTIATNNISGTAQMTVHNWVTIGRSGLGVVNMSNGQFSSDTQAFIVGIWGGSQGIWNQSGGSLNVNQDIWIGQGDNNAHATINLSGGTITNTGWIAVGREGAHGILNITGGTMVKAGVGNNISIAHNSGASGDVIISGTGTFLCLSGETWVGENAAPGTWTMNGGTAVLGMVRLAENADATGVMTLNAGSLTATEITTGNTGATQRELDFNGGTLVAGGDNANFIHDLTAANVKSGGAIIDTASHSVSVNQALLGVSPDGGLMMKGNGTLQLNAVNTYTNVTTVSAGTLGGAGTIAGPVKVAAGATLSPGTASIGTLTVNNTLTLSNLSKTFVKVSIDGGAHNDSVVGLTGVAYNGSLTVNNVGTNALTVGSVFQLFNVPGSITGNFSSVAILPFGHGTFNPATGQLTITSMVPPTVNKPVISSGNLILSGTGGTPGGGYTWLNSTSLTNPIAVWTVAASGVYDSAGAFSNAIPVSTTTPTEFFRFRTP